MCGHNQSGHIYFCLLNLTVVIRPFKSLIPLKVTGCNFSIFNYEVWSYAIIDTRGYYFAIFNYEVWGYSIIDTRGYEEIIY